VQFCAILCIRLGHARASQSDRSLCHGVHGLSDVALTDGAGITALSQPSPMEEKSLFHQSNAQHSDADQAATLAPQDWSASFAWTVDIKKASFAHFDTVRFKPGQLEAINALMSNRDVFVSLPAGGGKTRCYMLAAAVRSGLTIVISPSHIVIQERLRVAYEAAIPAGACCRGISRERWDSYRERLNAHYLKLLYLTPARFANHKEIRQILDYMYARGKLNAFVIHEAHRIYDENDAFPSAYGHLWLIRHRYPTAPIVCLSATATGAAQRSIAHTLALQDVVSICVPGNASNTKS